MFYTIYKVTHRESGKVYIGKHQTQDLNDGYMGSGKMISRAIKKYGVEAFEKEVLHVFDNEADMNVKEAELVTEEFCLREDTYNLCPGGQGGWGYVNQNNFNIVKLEPDVRKRIAKLGGKAAGASNLERARKLGKLPFNNFKGKKHSEETKKQMSITRFGQGTGSKNSQFGTMWITNEIINKKIHKDQHIENGWRPGRI
jgi:hypothetical protein